MTEKNITTAELAKEISAHRNSIHRYLAASKAPSLNTALKLCDFFNCSLEYLLGRTDNKIKYTNTMPPFSEQLRFLLKYFKSNENQLIVGTKLSSSRTHDWLSGKRIPSLDNIAKIANFYDCTIDFVIGKKMAIGFTPTAISQLKSQIFVALF